MQKWRLLEEPMGARHGRPVWPTLDPPGRELPYRPASSMCSAASFITATSSLVKTRQPLRSRLSGTSTLPWLSQRSSVLREIPMLRAASVVLKYFTPPLVKGIFSTSPFIMVRSLSHQVRGAISRVSLFVF